MTWRQIESAVVCYARSHRFEVLDHCGRPVILLPRSRFSDELTPVDLEAFARYLADELNNGR
jgi:hypothetical protein